MASANNQAAITLPVADLKGMTDFYAFALKPLGYGITGSVSRGPRGYPASQEVELGPAGTGLVDLRLSQSEKFRSRSRRPSSAAIVFPAASAVAVDKFYDAALRARGSDHSPPKVRYDDRKPLYATTVADIEGNIIEVQTEDIPQQHYRTKNMVQYQGQSSLQRARSRSHSATKRPTFEEAAPRTSPSSPRSRNEQPAQANNSYLPSKTMVGTLVGAAAGVALAYAAITSHGDSVDKEREYNRRVDERKQAKAEAWTNTYGADKQSYGRFEEPIPIRRKEDMYRPSPDSGYASGSPPDYAFGPPSRSFTFPPTKPVSSRRRSGSSPERIPRGIDIQSSKSKHSRPSKPLPPSPPPTREFRASRRPSYDGVAPRSSADGSTKTASNSPTYYSKTTARSYRSAKDAPPTSFRQESRYMSRSSRSSREAPFSPTQASSWYSAEEESDNDSIMPEDSISQVSSRRSARTLTTGSRRSRR